MKKVLIKPALTTLMLALSATWASAGETIQIGDDMELDWSLTAAYNVGMRVAKPDPLLTGEQHMWAVRYNDGNNNFDRWSLVNNRVSMLLQTKLTRGDSGLVINGTTFYDDVYHGGTDNSSNKFSPLRNTGVPATRNGIIAPVLTSTSAAIGEFTPEAKRLHGGYSKLLDVYGYTNLDLFGKRANIKLGRHVVSWGESLFFPNISMAQGPLDGSRANVPGTEIKEIMLPEDQVSLSWQLSPKTTLLANYQFAWHPTLIDAPGSYLARSDIIGPGGTCLGDWVGGNNPNAVCSFFPFDTNQLPEGPNAAVAKGAAGGPDILPKQVGSGGIGLRQRISEETELGFYYLRYNERIPLPAIRYNDPAIIGARSPISWNRFYQPNVHLLGASFTTSLGEYAVGGEISHRRGAPVLAGGDLPSGNFTTADLANSPFAVYGSVNGRLNTYQLYAPTTANLTQVNLNTFANFGRTFLAPRTLLLAELAWVNVSGFKSVVFQTNNNNVNRRITGDKLRLYSKNNVGIQTRFQLDYPGIAEGWDLSVPISYGQQLLGQNMISNLGGKGDKILAVSTEFTRGNLQLRADYVNWLGKPSKDDFGARVLTDRDFVSVGVKYTF